MVNTVPHVGQPVKWPWRFAEAIMAKPTTAELDDVAAHLLLFKPAGTVELPLPVHDVTLDPLFGALTTDVRFNDLSFAVIRYDPVNPTRTFLHNPDDNWDIGSCGKTSIATAALVLRHDVRSMVNAGVITAGITAAKFDALLRFVWARHPDKPIKKLGTDGYYPLPSKMFNEPTSPEMFTGEGTLIDFAALNTLSGGGHISKGNLSTTTFLQRLHLVIGQSDNRAARSCQGVLGIAFINAVLQKLGMFDPGTGNGLRVAGDYGPFAADALPTGWRLPVPISRAKARATSTDPKSADGRPYVATARALAALMSAVVENRFLDTDSSALFRDLLLQRPGFALVSWMADGINDAATRAATELTDQVFHKIGILWSDAEFVHVEFPSGLHYSVIVLGLLPKKIGGAWLGADQRSQALGDAIHTAILAAGP
jgi:hypothetical protein